jgi:hypothetical protein
VERVDTISDVRLKELPTGVTLYLLKDSQGQEYSTRNRDLARVAEEAHTSGQHVHLDYDEKKNDRGFTNRYLNAVRPIADGSPMTTVGQAMQEAQAAQANRPAGLFDDAEPEPAVVQTDKDMQIAKAVALKAAVDVLQYLPENQRTVANVETAAEHFTRWLVSWRP